MGTMALGAVIPTTQNHWAELAGAGRELETAGCEYIFCNEPPGSDALGAAFLLAQATRKAAIGTSVANAHLRHPYLTARSAAMLQTVSSGRFILGLGASHPSINVPLGVGSERPVQHMHAYVRAVREHLGSGQPPPVWLAALRPPMSRLAGEIAEGVIFHLVPVLGLARAVETVRAASIQAGRAIRVTAAAYLRIVVGEERTRAEQAAREMLRFYCRLPAYQTLFASHGFAEEMEAFRVAIAGGNLTAADAAISKRLLKETCVLGTKRECKDALERYAAAGVNLGLLAPVPIQGATLHGLFAPVIKGILQS